MTVREPVWREQGLGDGPACAMTWARRGVTEPHRRGYELCSSSKKDQQMVAKKQEELEAHARQARHDQQADKVFACQRRRSGAFSRNWKLLYPRTQKFDVLKKRKGAGKPHQLSGKDDGDSDLEGEVNEVITEVIKAMAERAPS